VSIKYRNANNKIMNLLTVIHYKHTGHLWVLINVSTPCFMDDKGLNTLEQSLVEIACKLRIIFKVANY
jgi:hypothetical protein